MSKIPMTYNASFHGDYESHPWISKMPYRILGDTDLVVSSLSYGGSSLGGFYGYLKYFSVIIILIIIAIFL